MALAASYPRWHGNGDEGQEGVYPGNYIKNRFFALRRVGSPCSADDGWFVDGAWCVKARSCRLQSLGS